MKKIFLAILVLISCTAFSQKKHYGNYEFDSLYTKLAQQGIDTTNFKIIVQRVSDGKHFKMYWPVFSGSTPTLQQVTDAGNTSTNDIIVNAMAWNGSTVQSVGQLTSTDFAGEIRGTLGLANTTNSFIGNVTTVGLTATRNYYLPNQSGELALTTNIPTALSGTYTPTVSGGSNLASSSTNANVMYTRVGNVVTVSGQIQATPTASGQVSWNIDLPVATANFSAVSQAGGTAAYVNGSSFATAKIVSNSGAQTVSFVYRAPDTAVADFSFTFQYTIQ